MDILYTSDLLCFALLQPFWCPDHVLIPSSHYIAIYCLLIWFSMSDHMTPCDSVNRHHMTSHDDAKLNIYLRMHNIYPWMYIMYPRMYIIYPQMYIYNIYPRMYNIYPWMYIIYPRMYIMYPRMYIIYPRMYIIYPQMYNIYPRMYIIYPWMNTDINILHMEAHY